MTPLLGTNNFIEALFHKGIIINTPALNPLGGTALEDVLSIFSPAYKMTNPHIMSINETSYPSQYRGLLRRLAKATANDEIRAKMQLEDGFFEEIQFMEDQLTNALNEKEAALHMSEVERQQKERAIRLLLDLGVPKEEISRQLELSDAEAEGL